MSETCQELQNIKYQTMLLNHNSKIYETTPNTENIEAFLESSQQHVSGDVLLTLKPYHFTLDGIVSEYDLMNVDFGKYGEENSGWTAEEAKGFIKIYGNQSKIYKSVEK